MEGERRQKSEDDVMISAFTNGNHVYLGSDGEKDRQPMS